MTAFARGPFALFFLRASLLTAALAIIGGIFGMHVITGTHNMPATAHAQLHSTPAVHLGHGTAQSPEAAAVPPAASGPSSSCPSTRDCTTMSAMDAPCVLSPGHTPLSAPAPGTAPFTGPGSAGAAVAGPSYSFSPGSPSPGDLCISRT